MIAWLRQVPSSWYCRKSARNSARDGAAKCKQDARKGAPRYNAKRFKEELYVPGNLVQLGSLQIPLAAAQLASSPICQRIESNGDLGYVTQYVPWKVSIRGLRANYRQMSAAVFSGIIFQWIENDWREMEPTFEALQAHCLAIFSPFVDNSETVFHNQLCLQAICML